MLIIFDLDDTLIDTTRSVTEVQLERALKVMMELGLQIQDFQAALFKLRELNHDSESASEALFQFTSSFEGGDLYFQKGVEIVYGPIPNEVEVLSVKGAPNALETLSRFCSLCLVSRGKVEQQLAKMKKAGIDSSLFSKMVIFEGMNKKPHYVRILDELKVEPRFVVVCGDRVVIDLEPAKELGCTTVHMKCGRRSQMNHKSSGVDFEIADLREIKRIVRGLELNHN